jgi:hypothetical protein
MDVPVRLFLGGDGLGARIDRDVHVVAQLADQRVRLDKWIQLCIAAGQCKLRAIPDARNQGAADNGDHEGKSVAMKFQRRSLACLIAAAIVGTPSFAQVQNQRPIRLVVAFAPVKPAEFVIIKIAQLAGQPQS